MYNSHRIPPGPPGPPPPGPPPNRVGELLDNLRVEFETQIHQNRSTEEHLHGQITELETIKQRISELEQQHLQMKNRYESEIQHLRRELEARGGPAPGLHPSQGQAQPPSIGHGPANLFQGIMSGNQGGPNLAPLPDQGPGGQPGMPGHMQQGPPGLNHPPGPPHNPFAYPGQQGPGAMNGYPGQAPPQPTASPGPGKPRIPGANLRGPATPSQKPQIPYPGSPSMPRPTPPPGPQQQQQQPPQPQQQQQLQQGPGGNPSAHPANGSHDFQYTHQQVEEIGNQLADYDPDKLPPNLKRQGEDWHAVFNPRTRRQLDVELVHNLAHQSVVCCVRFSADGRYVATGCNRSAQIYEVTSGHQVCHLLDPATNPEGDLYIRSVCFSPNGAMLATGAEDKIIRVWDIATKTIRHQFSGHEQDIYSLDFASDGRYIASGSGDRTIRLWDLQDNANIFTLTIEDGVTTVAMSPDGRYVAAGSLDKCVRIWDTQTGSMVERTEGDAGHMDSVYSVAFSPRGDVLVSGSLDKTIRMWRFQHRGFPTGGPNPPGPVRGDCIRVFEGHKDFVLSVALTPDGKWVMSGSKDRGVQFWDPETGDAQVMLQGHKNSVISVAPSPKVGLFATGSGDMKARIWRYTPYNGP